jgi:serine protease Do
MEEIAREEVIDKCRRPETAGQRVWAGHLVTTVIVVVLLPAAAGLGAGSPVAKTPETILELKELEARVRRAVESVLPAIVAVDSPARSSEGIHVGSQDSHFEDFGSGVIIQSDGLIVSQWHVTHQRGLAVWRDPGDQAEVVLQDGRRLKAKLLGADPVRDLSLLRIVEPGKYPHARLAPEKAVALGDWVLKLGHPFGYRKSRGAVARLGRVLYLGDSIDIVADCRIFGGDSGGPLFNLDGQVVGIVENSESPQPLKFEFATQRSGRPFCYTNVGTIRTRLTMMLHPAFGNKASGGVYVPDLPDFQAFNRLRRDEVFTNRHAMILPEELGSQGKRTLAAWNRLSDRCSRCVVEVLGGEQRVALGTVVGADGWILTKASEIPEYPRCRLPDGQIFSARVTGMDAAFDLAMLKIKATGLRAVEWVKNSGHPAGTFVAATDGRGLPFAVGIVSVAKRSLEGPFPTVVVKAPIHDPSAVRPPEVIGKPFENRGFRVTYAAGGAAEAGLRSGDLLLSINGGPVHESSDLDKSVKGHLPGETLLVTVERDGRRATCKLNLEAQRYVDCPGVGCRYRNFRYDNFPVVLEHDLPLTLDECGGPVIGLDGKALGISVARVGEHGCMAIPADAIEPRIAGLKDRAADVPY